ncbi:MAG: hypothetical protein IKM46_07465 [Clostridia bacterium]|nr:hypothetical protein [Clostridia bacterium]
MMREIFFSFFSISVVTCLLALMVALFFGLFGRRFSAKCRFAVWSILLIRLLVPVGGIGAPLFNLTLPASEVSLSENEKITETSAYAESETPSEERETTTAPPVTEESVFVPSVTVPQSSEAVETDPYVSDSVSEAPTGNTGGYIQKEPEELDSVLGKVTSTVPVSQEPSVFVPEEHDLSQIKADNFRRDVTLTEILDIFAGVWIVGAALCLAVKLGVYFSYSSALRRGGALADPTVKEREIYAKAATDLGIKRVPELRIRKDTDSPMLVGFFRPTVILSEVYVNDEGLYRIMTHELVHYRRGDLWVKLAVTAVESLYWFCPLIRFITAKLISEMELSCDEITLAGLGDEERVTYGEAVLAIVKNGRGRKSSLTTSFSSGGRSVKKRLDGIIDRSRKRKGLGVVALILVLSIASGSLFACTEEKAEENVKNSDQTAAETEKPFDDNGSEADDKNDKTDKTDKTEGAENTDINTESGNEKLPEELDGLDASVFLAKAYNCRDAYYDTPYLNGYSHEVNYSVTFSEPIEGYKLSVCKICVCEDGCSDEEIVGTAVSGYARAYDLEYLYDLDEADYPVKVFKWSLPGPMYEEYPDGENDPRISNVFMSTMYLVNVSENVRLVLMLDPGDDTPESEGERQLTDEYVSGVYVRDSAESEGKHHRYERYIFKRSEFSLYDTDGTVVYREYNDLSSVSLEERDGLVIINKGLGNGNETRYYSIEKNVLSEIFYGVASYSDGVVIYPDGDSGIVIKSVFDSSVYHYIEDRLDSSFGKLIENAYFENGKAVVKYRCFDGDDSEGSSVKTLAVELSKEDTNPECVHSYVKQSEIPATCGEDGSIRYACGICGAEAAYTEVLPKTGHRANDATCTTPSVCVDCGMWFAPEKGHDFTPATVDSPMRCKICGVSVGEPVVPINIDTESFKNVSDYVWNTAIPKCSNLSIYVKDGYYDLETRMYREAEILTAVRIDDVKYSSQSISDTEKYKVTFYFSGEVIRDETDTDTSYLTMVIFDKQTMEEMIYTVPYSDFSMGDAVQVELSAELKSGNYRIYFANGSKYSAIYN